MPIGDTLTVGKHTTLQEVRDFVERVGDDQRIHGKYNEKTGETVLYVGKKSPSLLSRVFGNWGERREIAKLAIFEVMDKTLQKSLGSLPENDPERFKLEALRRSIVESTNSVRGHSMRTDMIALLSKAVEGGTESHRKTEVPDDLRLLAPLGDLDDVFKDVANDLHLVNVRVRDVHGTSEKTFWARSVHEAGEKFGDALAERLLELYGHDKNLIAMFIASNEGDLKSEMQEQVKRAYGPGAERALTKERSQDLFNIAYDRMMSKLLNSNGVVPDTSTPIPKPIPKKNDEQPEVYLPVNLPNINVGGTEYAPTGYLGSGGGTDIYAYQALDGSGKEIAFKIVSTMYPSDIVHEEQDGDKVVTVTYQAIERLEDGQFYYRPKEEFRTDGTRREGYVFRPESDVKVPTVSELKSEIRSHAMLARGNHPNVLGLEGLVPLPGGQIGIAMEIAPGGNVLEFSRTLQKSILTGQITPEMAEIVRLTLIRDMAQGLDHIQNEQQSMHLDLKTPNVLIGDDGRPKISDFGLVKEGTHAPMRDGELPDNPIWTAPELGTGVHDLKAMQQAMQEIGTGRDKRGPMAWTPTDKSTSLKQRGMEVQGEVRNVLPNVEERTIRNLTTNILQPDHSKLRSEVEITGKFDTWALGIMALDVWTGTEQFRGKEYFSEDDEKPQFLPARVRDRLNEFGSDPNNRAIGYEFGQVNEPLFLNTTGNGQLDSLVNRLLDPTPEKRPEMNEVINDPVFDQPGVQSEEVYALIRAISEGDPDKIDEAKRALEESLRQPQ
jgi:serine/threonine protein kinase